MMTVYLLIDALLSDFRLYVRAEGCQATGSRRKRASFGRFVARSEPASGEGRIDTADGSLYFKLLSAGITFESLRV
jgi:hypothetical protein